VVIKIQILWNKPVVSCDWDMNNPLNRRLEKQEKEDIPGYSNRRIGTETDPLIPSSGRNSSTLLFRRLSNKSPTQHTKLLSQQSPTSLIAPSFVSRKRDNNQANNNTNNMNSSSMSGNSRLLDHDNINDLGGTGEHDGYESIDDVSIPSHQMSSTNNSIDPYGATDPTESFMTDKSSTGGGGGGTAAAMETTRMIGGGGDGRGNHRSGGSHQTNDSMTKGARMTPDARLVDSADSEQPPLLEIPEEVYAVRKAALQVLKPLNKTWVGR
jgi:hypothetical protein